MSERLSCSRRLKDFAIFHKRLRALSDTSGVVTPLGTLGALPSLPQEAEPPRSALSAGRRHAISSIDPQRLEATARALQHRYTCDI